METKLMGYMIQIGICVLVGAIIGLLFLFFFKKQSKKLKYDVQMMSWKFFYYGGMFFLGLTIVAGLLDPFTSTYSLSILNLFAMFEFFIMYKKLFKKGILPSIEANDLYGQGAQDAK